MESYFDCIKSKKDRIFEPAKLNKETEFFLKLIIMSEKYHLTNLNKKCQYHHL